MTTPNVIPDPYGPLPVVPSLPDPIDGDFDHTPEDSGGVRPTDETTVSETRQPHRTAT